MVPMSYHMGFVHINEKGMEREFEPYIRHYNSMREQGSRRLVRATA
jgi:hypothetical protein